MRNTVFYIIVVIIIFNYILGRVLSYLNRKMMNSPIPDILKDVYDEEKYKKSQEYKIANDKFEFYSVTFNLILILLMLYFEGFAYVDNISRNITSNPILITLIFFGILMFASDILSIPFEIYDIFVIEEKFGFNKTTPKIYITDKLKGWFLSILIGGTLLALITWFYYSTRQYFWLYSVLLIIFFTIFINMFYSTLIVPLFNKQTPLEPGPLRDKIEDFCRKANFKLENIYVIDSSKRSTKSNAYFTGIGKKKRIVLYDTLIKDMSPDEIVAVLAHEIGHYKLKHVVINIFTSIVYSALVLYIFTFFAESKALSEALGSQIPSFHLALISFTILYSPISMIIGLITNYISRKKEFDADNFAAKHGMAEHLISALKKLTSKNLSNLTPHPVYVFFYYSHPPLYDRVKNLIEKQKIYNN